MQPRASLSEITVDATSTINEVVIEATYIAEIFSGAEDVLMHWGFFVAASSTSFIDMDILEVLAPAVPDDTLADFGWNLVGSRASI